jgi:hypothetical protein
VPVVFEVRCGARREIRDVGGGARLARSHWLAPLYRRAPPGLFRDAGNATRTPSPQKACCTRPAAIDGTGRDSASHRRRELKHLASTMARRLVCRTMCKLPACYSRVVEPAIYTVRGRQVGDLRRKLRYRADSQGKNAARLCGKPSLFWRAAHAARSTPRGRRVMRRILVVDDDLNTRLAMGTWLKQMRVQGRDHGGRRERPRRAERCRVRSDDRRCLHAILMIRRKPPPLQTRKTRQPRDHCDCRMIGLKAHYIRSRGLT